MSIEETLTAPRPRPASLALCFAVGLGALASLSPAWAQDAPVAPVQEQVQGPVEAEPAPDEAAEAERRRRLFPLWAEPAIERGEALPLPFGIGVVAVADEEAIYGDRLSVRLAKGDAPPAGAVLIKTPGVSFDNIGTTRSLQVKADVWVLPFLNLFVSLGQIDGDIAINVDVDLDELLPAICTDRRPCGTRRLHFDTPLDNTTTTFGATFVYGTEVWFAALSATRTISVADKDRSDISSTMVGLRAGPRLVPSEHIRVEPYLGINRFELDTQVKGVASLPDAFPDGDALSVRYQARVENKDDYSVALGANAEIGKHWFLQAEYGHADGGDRFILSTTYRF